MHRSIDFGVKNMHDVNSISEGLSNIHANSFEWLHDLCMELYSAANRKPRGRIFIANEVPLTLRMHPGSMVRCLDGTTWLTVFPHDKLGPVSDRILVPGQMLQIEQRTTVYLSSLKRTPSRIELLDPLEGTNSTSVLVRLRRRFFRGRRDTPPGF